MAAKAELEITAQVMNGLTAGGSKRGTTKAK